MASEKKVGQISLLMRLLPEEPSTDLKKVEEQVRRSLPKDCALEGTEVKPFAFGLKALMCKIVVPDLEGEADKIEELLRTVPSVQGVEFVNMSRVI